MSRDHRMTAAEELAMFGPPDCELCHEPSDECECPNEYRMEHDSGDMER